MIFNIQFHRIDFDTDDTHNAVGDSLHELYGNTKIRIEAGSEDEALDLAFDKITNRSGYCINSSSYDIISNTPFYLQVLEFIKSAREGCSLSLIQHNFLMDRHREQTRIAVWKLEKLELVMFIDGRYIA